MAELQSGGTAADPALAERARRLFEANVRLYAALGGSQATASALDILLFLLAEDRGAGVATTRTCTALGVPRTTALRWINALATEGLVEQREDERDRRVTRLRVAAPARAALDAWLRATTGADAEPRG